MMMSQIESIKVIKTLDNPLRFLYWEYSQVIFCLMAFLLGLMSQNLLVSLIFSGIAIFLYKKVKRLLIKNFKRFSYWTFFAKNTKEFPPSYKRSFIR
jgi:type IV conjugative transfer system protein TraL